MTRIATHRIQLTPDLGFDDVIGILDVLVRLGVSDLYLSPIAEAVPGSRHGYDVVDHTRVRAELGGRDGLGRLLDAAHENRLGVVIDHVPNHASVERAELNAPWWETLRDGAASPAARWFDIDWDAADGRVIVPKLGSPLDDVLDAGGIEIGTGDLGPEVRYGPLRFPLAEGTEDLDPREALDRQHYRLAWWRDPRRNVRRFFTIDDLVAVRVEHPEVADAVDTLPAELTEHPAFTGVRVDHVDGLADPGGYLERLRDRIGDRWLIVEKILAPGEDLPRSWPVDGTTGYEHITLTEHTLLDPSAERHLSGAWRAQVDDRPFSELELDARREVLDGGLRPDLDRLVRTLPDDAHDVASTEQLRDAVTRLTLGLHRYRTYLPDDEASIPAFDEAARRARDGVGDRDGDGVGRDAHLDLVVDAVRSHDASRERWQQLTGPVMAKGAEDRAFYRSFALASLAEVGGTPGAFSTDVAAFHDAQRDRQRDLPAAMLAETTHDTKRSAAVRARSLALAAHAERWTSLVDAWLADHHDEVADLDPGIVRLAIQTAVTARPLTVERLGDYLVKAAREGDVITSWTEPDEAIESALGRLAGVLVAETDPGRTSATSLGEFAATAEHLGARVGLRMLALHLTCPGVPDLYQGSPAELTSLVDPDNRSEPDWERLRSLIDRVASSDTATAVGEGDADLARAVLTERILRMRARRADAFGPDGGYAEVAVDGDGSEHVIALARTHAGDAVVVTVVSRALASAPDGRSTSIELPEGSWRDVVHDDARILTGGSVRLVDVLGADGDPGVAVLERTDL
ncbi:malto-oligosyltrehalose synthase [Ilumatobacter sp.]|uniref:malto-oligosyltrehalose synthase n=1 Tax=Ilumatobacter sp. TaxID=1967498 RepID=UPI003B5196EC